MGRSAEGRHVPPRSQVPRGCIAAVAIPSALVIAAIVYIVAVQGGAAERVGREIATLRAAGKPVTASEAVPPPVAAADNAAPLYLQASASLPKRNPNPYAETQWGDPASVALLAECLCKDTATTTALGAATRLPSCRFGLGQPNRVYTAHSEYQRMRELARVCAAAASLAALQGDTEQGVEWLRRGLVLSRHMSDEGETMACLVAFATDGIALKAAERVVAAGPVAVEAAQRLSSELQAVDYTSAGCDAFEADRARTVELYDRVRADPAACSLISSPTAFLGATAPTTPMDKVREWVLPVVEVAYRRSGGLWNDELRYLRVVAEAEGLVPRPWRETHTRWAAVAPDPGVLDSLSLSAQLEPSYIDRLVQKRDTVLARRGLLQAALALNRYKAEHGVYPKALSEVRIEGLPIPDDVFTGRPFVYRKTGESFVLYSLGTNLKDDGGKDDAESGDIVWDVAPRSLAKPSSRTQTGSGKRNAR